MQKATAGTIEQCLTHVSNLTRLEAEKVFTQASSPAELLKISKAAAGSRTAVDINTPENLTKITDLIEGNEALMQIFR